MLQQYLPFTVLKHHTFEAIGEKIVCVATVLTVYGIETAPEGPSSLVKVIVATVLTVYGIETYERDLHTEGPMSCNSTYRLRY